MPTTPSEPEAPLLSYVVFPDPSPLQTESKGSLKIIASNSSRVNQVVVKQIKIMFSSGANSYDLTPDAGSIVVQVKGEGGWNTTRDGGTFTLTKNVPPVVESLEITLSSISVNAVPGDVKIAIYEISKFKDATNWNPERKWETRIWKESQTLWIRNFQATPEKVPYGGATTLTWSASSAATLTLTLDKDGKAPQEKNVTGKSSYRVEDMAEDGDIVFELAAFLGGNRVASSKNVTVRPKPPKILEFYGERRGGKLYLNWQTEGAKECVLGGSPTLLYPSAKDFPVDDRASFLRLTAVGSSGETVSRDLFEYKESESQSLNKLSGNYRVEFRVSGDNGGAIVYNMASKANRQSYYAVLVNYFPQPWIDYDIEHAGFDSDANIFALTGTDGVEVVSVEGDRPFWRNGELRALRVDFAPDGWGMLISKKGTGNNYFVQRTDRIGKKSIGHLPCTGPVIAVSRDERLYLDSNMNAISCMNWSTGKAPVIQLPSSRGWADIAVSDRDMVYVALPYLNQVVMFDGRDVTKGILKKFDVGRSPRSVFLTGNELLVANGEDAFISVIDVVSQKVVEPIPVPEPMGNVIAIPWRGIIGGYALSRKRIVWLSAKLRGRGMAFEEVQMPEPTLPEELPVTIDFAAVPPRVPENGVVTLAWNVASNEPGLSYTLDAPGSNVVDSSGTYRFAVESLPLEVTLNVSSESFAVSRTIEIQAIPVKDFRNYPFAKPT